MLREKIKELTVLALIITAGINAYFIPAPISTASTVVTGLAAIAIAVMKK